MAQYVTMLFLLVLLALVTFTPSEATKYRSLQRLKETNMVFYMHDLILGNNITAIPVAGVPTPKGGYDFLKLGTLVAIDDKLTEAFQWDSPQVGRARGIYVNSALDGSDLHLVLSLVFTSKEYNGSTLEIQGSDRMFLKYREVSVVSGTGKFRLARGFAVLETVFLDIPSLYGILRWNITVLHY